MRRVCFIMSCAAVSFLTAAGVLLMCAPLAAAPADGSPAADSGLLTIEVTNVPLQNVIQLLIKDSGVNIVVAGSEKMDMPITASIRNQPLEKILQLILSGSGVNYTRTPDGTFVIGASVKPEPAAPAAPTLDQGQDATVPQPEIVAPAQKHHVVVEKIQLQNVSVKTAMTALGVEPIDAAVNPSVPAKPFRGGFLIHPDLWEGQSSITVPPDSLGPQNTQTPAVPAAPSAPTSDTANPQVANRSSDPYSTARQYVPRTPYSTTTTGTRPGTTTGGVRSTSGSENLRPDGIDAIIPFEQDNSLLVKGEDDAVQELKDLITLVDVPPKQVMIKAEFVEVDTNLTKRLGIDWLLTRPNYAVQTAFNPGGNVIGYVQSGNLTANLRAELTQGGGKVVNAPIISTLNNTAATISVGREIPFYQSQTVVSSGGTTTQGSSVTYIDASTQLNVLPQINGDNSITLIMQPQVSDSTSFVAGPGGSQAPIVSQEMLSTARRVANGETIVIGGFIKKNDSNGGSRVPILADLPIIGKLFQSNFDIRADTETLIFVTPTVIQEKTSSQAVGVIQP